MVPGRIALVVFLTVLVQVTVISPVEVAGGQGNIVLLLAIVAGLESNPERGAIVGFAGGLLFDMLLDTPVGLSALSLALIGYSVGSVKDYMLRSSAVFSMGLVALASIVGTLLYAVLAVVFGVTVPPGGLPAIVAVIAVLNVVLSKPMRWVVRWAFGPESRSLTRERSVFR